MPAAAKPAQHGALTGLRVRSTTVVRGGVRGSGRLSQRHMNTVAANSKLAFVVSLHNNGARRHVRFTVSIRRPRFPNGPLVVSKTVWLRADLLATVKVGPFRQVLFAVPSRVKVSVVDRASRQTWTASYPVIFSLG
jgi:hypothetical protein